MWKISKEFHFSASHQLSGLDECHPCSRLHGHNYIIVVYLESVALNDVGFVKDYRELDTIKKYIDDNLDHRHLNDVFDFNPSAENMSKYFYNLFKKDIPFISGIEVCETPKTKALYYES